MNFPMHIFGFPYASYATDGDESLFLTLALALTLTPTLSLALPYATLRYPTPTRQREPVALPLRPPPGDT